MAGRRATEFAETVKRFREEMRLSKDETLGFLSVSTEVAAHIRNKAKKLIAKAEAKANGETRRKVRNW